MKLNNGKEIEIELNEDDEAAIPVYGSGGVFKFTNNYLYDGVSVMFGRKGTLGKPLYVKGKFWTVDTMYYLTYTGKMNPKYNYYELCVFDWEPFITQTALPSIVASKIVACRFPIPPLIEQEKIAEFLDEKCSRIDSVIEKTKASIEEYKKLKQAVITEAVTKGVSKKSELKESGYEFVDKIPSEWKIFTLGQLSKTMRNGYVGPTRNLFVDDGIPYIQSLHVKDGKIDFSRGEYYVAEEWGNQHPKIHKGDIVIVQTGDIGQVGLVDEKNEGNNCHALIIVRIKEELMFPEYLTYYFRSSVGKEQLLLTKTGALLPHLNSGKIKFARIICPPISEQKIIVKILNKKCEQIDALIHAKEIFLTEIEQYKKSFIYEYVTGKKEVPSA